jgi:hypothetical protein
MEHTCLATHPAGHRATASLFWDADRLAHCANQTKGSGWLQHAIVRSSYLRLFMNCLPARGQIEFGIIYYLCDYFSKLTGKVALKLNKWNINGVIVELLQKALRTRVHG